VNVVLSRLGLLLLRILFFASVLLCALFGYYGKGYASSVRVLNPTWSVDDQQVDDFIKAMVQTYFFYAKFPDKSSQPNFVFLSEIGLLENGHLKRENFSKFFPGISDETIDELSGESDECLIFTLNIQSKKMVVGVNNSDQTGKDQTARCFMATLAYFIDKEKFEDFRGENISETARNIIKELQRKLDE